MSRPQRSADLESLLAHAEWVRTVARRLVGEAAAADDVVQNTWVAALERPPRAGGNLRAWLAQVVRNQARQRGRAASRALRRERAVAREEAQSSTDELAERAALQRELVGHVLELDEPFRTVVLLRFFEDLAPPRIAARLGVPLKTVHSRLQRAFDKLRAKLDSEYGDTRRWCLALLPLAAARDVVPLATGGSLLAKAGLWTMNTNAKAALAAAAVLLGGVGLWRVAFHAEAADPNRSAQAAAKAPEVPVTPDAGPAELAASASPRTAIDVEEPPAPAPVAASADGLMIRGRVVDLDGRGVEGVGIALEDQGTAPLGVTAVDGAFEVRLPPEFASLQRFDAHPTPEAPRPSFLFLRVEDERWITLRQSCVQADNVSAEHVVVAAPAASLEGWVEGDDGAPIAGASVRLSPLNDAYFGFPFALDRTAAVPFETQSDATGRFAFPRFPRAAGLMLIAGAAGHSALVVSLDEAQRPLLIRLARHAETDGPLLEGVVLDERGRAVEGAAVQLGGSRTTTDRAGLFRLPVRQWDDQAVLCASKLGSLPAVVPGFGALVATRGDALEPVQLVLGGAPLAVAGRVVDESGAACAGWLVSLVDETPISHYRIPVDTAESLVREHASEVTTDAEGAFRIEGLYPRSYVVQAFHRESLVRTEMRVVAGDEGVLLRADRGLRGPLRGVVVDRRGAAIAGARVALSLDTYKTPYGSASVSAQRRVTDAAGAFVIEQLPKRDVWLQVDGDQVVPQRFELPAELGSAPLELVVSQRCHFRIELATRLDEASSAVFYDAQDRFVQVSRFEANAMGAMLSARLVDGRSEVLTVSDAAVRVAILDADEVELMDAAVSLVSGDVNVIRL